LGVSNIHSRASLFPPVLYSSCSKTPDFIRGFDFPIPFSAPC
jgi:hypothetical protein